MDTVFALVGKDYVLVVADTTVGYSIMRLKDTEDKITVLDDTKVMALAGETPDRNAFSDYIKRNMELYYYRNGQRLNTHAAANFTRTQLAKALRKAPYQVHALIAGFDKDGTPELYWLDYLGTLQKIMKGAHGYAAYFVSSVLENNYFPDMTLEEGLEAVKRCRHEMRTRFLINQPHYLVKCVDKNGVRVIDLDNNSV